MPSFGGLKESFVLFGCSPTAAASTMRYLHEGGFFDRAAKSPFTPQIEVVHGAIAVLALLAPEMQIAVGDDVRNFWRLRTRSFGNRVNSLYAGAPLLPSSLPYGAVGTLGDQLSALIERFADPDPEKRMGVPETTLIIWRSQGMAAIQTDKTSDRFIGDPDSLEAPLRRPSVSIMAVAQREVFQRIGDLVRESRAEAVRRGVTIPVSKAYAALGLAPSRGTEPQVSAPNISPDIRLSQIPVPDENAASLPGVAASVDYQDRKATPETSTSSRVGERKKLLKPHAKRGLGPSHSGVFHDRNIK